MIETKYIAVVDDHTMFRKGITTLINLFSNYRVMFDAQNGADFIKKLDSNNLPDIVLLDIVMPEMDGYSTANWIRTHHPEIKILALSTMEGETAIIKMIMSGAKGYILKDADPSELRRAFDDVEQLGYYYNEKVTRKIIQSVSSLADEKTDVHSFTQITQREMEFLKLVCSERTYAEIAKEMFLSERTIDGYRETLFRKLCVTSRVGLVIYAFRNGIVS